MFTAKTYFAASTVDEAYELLLRHKTNTVLGGCGWLKMTNKRIWAAIDLSGLGLDSITESGSCVRIGAMVTLRQLETDPRLKKLYGGILPESVRRIVGVQFRNGATVGGSVFSRFGFSDLLTALLALEATVVLRGAGELPLAEFAAMPYKKDLLLEVVIPKDGRAAAYESMRLTATDFPVLTAAVSRKPDGSGLVVLGARPARAAVAKEASALFTGGEPERAAEAAAKELSFSSNQRAGAAYRRAVAPVLLTRCMSRL